MWLTGGIYIKHCKIFLPFANRKYFIFIVSESVFNCHNRIHVLVGVKSKAKKFVCIICSR